MSKIHKSHPFGTAPNSLLNNPSISLKAKGLYTFMDSKPEYWDFTRKGMVSQLKESFSAIDSALSELKEHGYVEVKSFQNNLGHWDSDYYLFYEPKLTTSDKTSTELADSEKPLSVEPVSENHPTKKEINTKKEEDINNTIKKPIKNIKISKETIGQQNVIVVQEYFDKLLVSNLEDFVKEEFFVCQPNMIFSKEQTLITLRQCLNGMLEYYIKGLREVKNVKSSMINWIKPKAKHTDFYRWKSRYELEETKPTQPPKANKHERPLMTIDRKDYDSEHAFLQDVFCWTETNKDYKVTIIK